MEGGPEQGDVRLTRDGRFLVDVSGRLVRAEDGRAVLDEGGRPIRLDATQPATIDGAGAISQAGGVVARLQVVSPASADALVKDGGNLFRFREPEAARSRASGIVRQGMLETSGVDPIRTMTSVIDVSRAFERNARMIQIFDQNLSRVINTLGRVA